MWLPKGHHLEKKGTGNGLVAVAIDKDKGSQHALKWAAENLLSKGKTVILIHVVQLQSSASQIHHSHALSINATSSPNRQHLEALTKDLFLTFHCYCTRKDIHCLDVVLEDTEVVRALTDYVSYAAIENLVLGSSSKHGFIRFKTSGISSGVSKAAPDFCTVYIISKGKISSARNASHPVPYTSPLLTQIQNLSKQTVDPSGKHSKPNLRERTSMKPVTSIKPSPMQEDSIRSPLAFGTTRFSAGSLSNDMSELESDISFVSSSRPSPDRTSSFLYDAIDLAHMPRMSVGSEGHGSIRSGPRFSDHSSLHDFSSVSQDSGRTSSSSQNMDEVEMEMRRLRLELKQTMEMYSTACKEALTAKQKALELHHWRLEEERRFEESRVAEETALSMAEREKARCRAAVEEAEAAQRIAKLEARKRLSAEMKALRGSDEVKGIEKGHVEHAISSRYRRYGIEEIEVATNFFSASQKIGEGGYGPVYKCYLDYTPVAVKILRPDAAQGRSQFNQEVEVLSCIRHPNMVLLLGACPEYGCLVYEYMANGSLEDRLLQRGNSRALSWQVRFRIAAEIATGLLFLHQTKPEPIVHRDLKPGNILLDHHYVSKISDVGLARLVPPAVAENMTQYRMTSTAGTFCYIDPEYQQTGMLGVKSDVYSLGIMLLQLITAKPPMGITYLVSGSIEEGNFSQVLDPQVPDWPIEEALSLAKIALQCSELRRKDRPDLGKVVLPELSRLRDLAEDNMNQILVGGGGRLGSSTNSQGSISTTQEVMSDPQLAHIHSGSSSKSQSNASAATIS